MSLQQILYRFKVHFLSRRIVQILLFVVILLLSFLLLWFARSSLDADNLLARGYVGLFLANLITGATILFPIPGEAVTVAAGAVLNPLNVAVVATMGATIGEMTAYLAGLWGRNILLKGYSARYEQAKGWMNRHGMLAVFLFALIPMLMYDLIGIFAGSTRYHFGKFIAATFAGRFIRLLIYAYMGHSAVSLLQLPW